MKNEDDEKRTAAGVIFYPVTWLFTKIWKFIGDLIYRFKVKLNQRNKEKNRKPVHIVKEKTKEKLFLTSLFIWPAVCFILAYVIVNINSFLLAFKIFDENTLTFHWIADFRNFTRIFDELRAMPDMRKMVWNSLFIYFYGYLITTPVSILIALFIYKKVPGEGFFVFMLYLPSLISEIVWVLIYKYFVEYGLPIILGNYDMLSLINNPNTSFIMTFIFSQWMGFSGGLLINTGAMTRVPKECIEAGLLDGCNMWNEFFHIILPIIYPTVSISIFTGVAGIFTASPPTFAFFGSNAPIETWTFGYYFFKLVIDGNATSYTYPYASAAGLLFTAVCAPIVFFTKWLVEKGPNVET